MNERELEKLEKEVKKENEEMHQYAQTIVTRAYRIFDISNKILKPKGLIFDRCPLCNKRLNRVLFPSNSVYAILAYYQCECGYEYARRY